MSIISLLRSLLAGAVDIAGEGLVAGLGNAGAEYRNTRHNIGFLVIDELASRFSSGSYRAAAHAYVASAEFPNGAHIILAKPTTYMNRSGLALASLKKRFALNLDSCLVIVDDFNLALGAVRFRRKGSAGGHNGLKSIIEQCGEAFPRLRVGIGSPTEGANVIDYVLGEFTPAEKQAVGQAVAKAAEAVSFFWENGIDAAMNRFN